MAQLLMQGTNYVNFIGRYCWVGGRRARPGRRGRHRARRAAGGHRQHAAPAGLPRRLPQAPRGAAACSSTPTSIPGRDIGDVAPAPAAASPRCWSVQARGEYLYAACGEGGLRVFDIAFIDDKGFSERITTAPVSPLGQRFFVRTKYATAVAAPTTIAPDPTRTHRAENHEPTIHAMYGYIYVADKYEGLIIVGAGDALDGNPLNNFLEARGDVQPRRHPRRGAQPSRSSAPTPTSAATPGLVVVSLDDPKNPKVTSVVGARRALKQPRAVPGAVPLRLRLRRGGHQGPGRDRPRPPAAGRGRCRSRRRTTSTWRGPMPTSRPASTGW